MRLPTLLRREPFGLLRGWPGDGFEKLFAELFGRTGAPMPPMTEGELAFVPDIDVIERENEYVIKAELPGLAQEDVEVTMVGDALHIKGEKKTEKEEKDENTYFCERTYGTFFRMIPLPVAIEAGKITAKLEKGILEVVAPKAEAVKPTKIEVKGAPKEEAAPKSVEAPRPREEKPREKR